ncbi:hypothetical protein ACO9S2_11335 [Nitrospira sp. NS4]|uniref:hypothetical protein n=1 Tax=Nitrospira sp. NS4 TaxID=3414498 RepID=UPI003C3053DA
MRVLLYSVLIAGLVVLHTTLLPHLSVWNIKPDVGLVAVCFVGLLAGELEGLLVGLFLGWAMSLFSAGDLAASMTVKGGAGFLAGLAGRQMAQVTPILLVSGLLVASIGGGLVTMWAAKLSEQQNIWWVLQTIIVPQACLDAVIGGIGYWLLWSRFHLDRLATEQEL